MNIGRFSVEQLSEGKFQVYKDGTFQRIDTEESSPAESLNLPIREPSKVGINPILIRDQDHTVLLDTGLGWGLDAGSHYTGVSNLRTNLDIFGIKPEEVTHVILSHLHYDHAAGATFNDAQSQTNPTFPNAGYYLQHKEWDYAVNQVGKDRSGRGAGYRLDELYRLAADDRFIHLSGRHKEIIPGIEIIPTGGHTPGHQAVKVADSGEVGYYLGDLLPSEEHLNEYGMHHLDLHPAHAKKMKVRLMRDALEENAYLLFYHSLYSRVGRLKQDDEKNYVLKED